MSERPLRFCHITTFYPPYSFGGDAVYVHALANELAARGHHVEVIHCRDAYHLLNSAAPAQRVENHPGVIVHGLESGVGLVSPLATQQTGLPLFKQKKIEAILARGFDVIHYHNISLVGGPGVLTLGDAIKLYSTHEYWLVCPTSVLFRYDGAACIEKKCLRCTLAHGRPPQWWRYTNLLRNAARHVDAFICPSRFSRDRHAQERPEYNSVVIPNFHVTPQSDAPSILSPSDRPYFLYVGRLEQIKGIQTLLPFFAGYMRARLVIAGDGALRGMVEQAAAQSDNFKFLGWQSHADLQKWYRGATALIVPSLCYEGGPLVLYEAFSHGIPVIARDIGSLGEFVRDNQAGLMFHDNAELELAANTLIEEPARRDIFADNARRAYRTDHTPQVHLERYLNLIDALWEKKHKGT